MLEAWRMTMQPGFSIWGAPVISLYLTVIAAPDNGHRLRGLEFAGIF